MEKPIKNFVIWDSIFFSDLRLSMIERYSTQYGHIRDSVNEILECFINSLNNASESTLIEIYKMMKKARIDKIKNEAFVASCKILENIQGDTGRDIRRDIWRDIWRDIQRDTRRDRSGNNEGDKHGGKNESGGKNENERDLGNKREYRNYFVNVRGVYEELITNFRKICNRIHASGKMSVLFDFAIFYYLYKEGNTNTSGRKTVFERKMSDLLRLDIKTIRKLIRIARAVEQHAQLHNSLITAHFLEKIIFENACQKKGRDHEKTIRKYYHLLHDFGIIRYTNSYTFKTKSDGQFLHGIYAVIISKIREIEEFLSIGCRRRNS